MIDHTNIQEFWISKNLRDIAVASIGNLKLRREITFHFVKF